VTDLFTATGEPRTYGAIERTKSGWKITAIEPHVAIRLKAIFPRIPKAARLPIHLEGGTQVDADLEWFMARYPLAMKSGERDILAERKTLFDLQQAELTQILAKDWKPSAKVAFREGQRPYDYQAQAAELVRRTGRLLLMDGLGLGKTISALATVVAPECLPAAIVVQAHLPSQWAARIEEFTHLRVHVIKKAKPYHLPPADVYIFKFSSLAGWSAYFERAPFKAVVYDEMQELRHGVDTGKGRAAAALSAGAKVRMGLTATPIYGYGYEIWNICRFLDEGVLGPWWDFVREWCKPGPGGKWVVKDPKALGTYLREQNMTLMRTDEDVGNELQPLNVIQHTVPLNASDAEMNDELARSLAMKVVSGSFVERGLAAREFDIMMRQWTGVAKARAVAAYARILLDAGQPIVLVGWHREVYSIWLKELEQHRPLLYTGSESPAQKDKTKRLFVEGQSDCMILSLRSGAGLDGLQRRSHTMIFGELDWSPEVHAQCCVRLRRPGQKHQVDAIYLVADGGSDPAVLTMLGLKSSQSRGIVNPTSEAGEQHSDATRIRQLAEMYLRGQSHATPRPAAPMKAYVDPQITMGV